MITLFTFIILSLTLFYRKNSALILLCILVFLCNGCGFTSKFLLSRLQIYKPVNTPQWQQHNAIVLLGSGTVRVENEVEPMFLAFSRIYQAAHLYNLCKIKSTDCKIIVSGGDALQTGLSEAQVYKSSLTKIGIPNQDIVLEDKSLNTFKNAEFTSQLLKTLHADKIYLVTSGIHMQRSVLYFTHFDIPVIPAIADYIPMKLTPIPIGVNFAMADMALHEILGIFRYRIYEYLGWNFSLKNKTKLA